MRCVATEAKGRCWFVLPAGRNTASVKLFSCGRAKRIKSPLGLGVPRRRRSTAPWKLDHPQSKLDLLPQAYYALLELTTLLLAQTPRIWSGPREASKHSQQAGQTQNQGLSPNPKGGAMPTDGDHSPRRRSTESSSKPEVSRFRRRLRRSRRRARPGSWAPPSAATLEPTVGYGQETTGW